MINPRQLTAVHEAGHAVVAEHDGLAVRSIDILDFQTGATDVTEPDPPAFREQARVAVAGYAAVGVVLGPEAETQNREADSHEEADSDLFRAIGHAVNLGVPEHDLDTYLLGLEDEVRGLLASNPYKGMLIAIAEGLSGPSGSTTSRDRMSGDEVRHLMNTVRDSWVKAGSPE